MKTITNKEIEKLETPIGEFEFINGYPTDESVEKLYGYLDFQRGIKAYLDFMPAMSMQAIFDCQKDKCGVEDSSTILVYADLLDSAPIVLTGNTESVYSSTQVNLEEEGPVVIEAPPMVLGVVDDAYQRYVIDIGLAGPDRGKGGKYLLVPPGYEGEIPEGYFVAKPRTYMVWVMLRGDQKVSGRGEKALKWYRENMKIYPLDNPDRPNIVANISRIPNDTTHPNDFRYFENLNRMIQREPTEAFEPEQLGLLAAIGIEKGKPFEPDDRMRRILDTAAKTGFGMAKAIGFRSRDEEAKVYPDRNYETIFVGGSHEFLKNGHRNLDARILFHFTAIVITPAMVNKMVGTGSQYLGTYVDNKNEFLDGGKSYKLHLPKDIPVNNFWSVTVYDCNTRSLLQTENPFPSISSFTDPAQNEDGSYDIYFGPEAPEGKERNWIQTVPGKGWFTYIRFYGPLQPFFDKTWKPDDIVEI